MAAAGAGGAGLGAHFVRALDPLRDLWTYPLTEVIRTLYGDQASNSFKLGGIKDFREIFEHFDPTRQCLEVIGGPYILDKIINLNTKVLSQADAQLAVAKQKKAAPPGATVENCWICGLPIDEAIPGLKSECEHVLPVMQAALFLELFGSKHVQLKKKLEEEMKALVNSEKELNKVQSKKMVGLLQAATEKVISAKKNVEIAGKAYVDGLRILKLEYLWAHAGCNRLKHNDSYITSGFLTDSMGQNLRCAIVNETVIYNFFKELYYTSKKVEVLPVRTLIYKTYPPDLDGVSFKAFYTRQLEYFKKYLQPICNYINQCIGQTGCTITYDQICAASIEKLASPTAIRAEYYPIMENALNTIKISKESAQFAAFSKYVNDAFRKKMLALFTDSKPFIPPRLIEFKTKLNKVYNKLIDDKLFQIFADLRLRLFMMYKKNDNSDSLINDPAVHTNISELFYYLFIKYSIKTTSSDYDNSKIVKAYIINDQPVISLIESLYVYNQLSHDLKELTPEDGLEIRDALENTNKSTDTTIAQATSVVVQTSAVLSQAQAVISKGQQLTLEQQNQVVQAQAAGTAAQAAGTEAQTTKNKLAEIATIPQYIPPPAIVAELNRNLRLCQNFTNTVLLPPPAAPPGQIQIMAPEVYVYQQLIEENPTVAPPTPLNAADTAAAALLLQLKAAPPYPELTDPGLYNSEKKQLEELHIFQALLSIIDICNIPNPNVIGSNNYYYNESQRLDDIISIVNTLAQYNNHQNLAYLKSEIYANKYSLFNEIIEEYIIDTAHFSDLNDTAPTAIAIATFRAHAARTNKPFFDLPEPNTTLHARYIADFNALPFTSRTYEITVLVLYLRAIANAARARRVDSRAIKTQNKNLFILAEIAEGLIAPDSEIIIGVQEDGVNISIPANTPGSAAAINPLMHFATIAAENSFELAKASAVAALTTGGFFKYSKRRHSKTHVKKRQGRKQKHAKTIRRRNKQQVKKRPIQTHRRRVIKRNKSRKYRT